MDGTNCFIIKELDTWLNASKETVTPVDKPIATVDIAQQEIEQIGVDSKNQYAEYNHILFVCSNN